MITHDSRDFVRITELIYKLLTLRIHTYTQTDRPCTCQNNRSAYAPFHTSVRLMDEKILRKIRKFWQIRGLKLGGIFLERKRLSNECKGVCDWLLRARDLYGMKSASSSYGLLRVS